MTSGRCEYVSVEHAEVTVVIPVWGTYAKDLPRAVASAAHARANVLVVDNANRPALDIPVPTLRLDSRVSLGQARNAALPYVHTPYVLFLDADDELLPGALDQLLTVAGAPATHPVVVAARLLDASTGQRYHWPHTWQERLMRHAKVFAVAETIRAAYPVQGSLLPTDVVRECGGYDVHEDAAEDWTLGVSLAWRCQVRPASQPTMVYRSALSGRWGSQLALSRQLAHRRRIRGRVQLDPAVRLGRVTQAALLAAHTLGALRETLAHTRFAGRRSGLLNAHWRRCRLERVGIWSGAAKAVGG